MSTIEELAAALLLEARITRGKGSGPGLNQALEHVVRERELAVLQIRDELDHRLKELHAAHRLAKGMPLRHTRIAGDHVEVVYSRPAWGVEEAREHWRQFPVNLTLEQVSPTGEWFEVVSPEQIRFKQEITRA